MLVDSFAYFVDRNKFEYRDHVLVQKQFDSQHFEKVYVTLREREGRLLEDADVKRLPSLPRHHLLYREFQVRKQSTARLSRYLLALRPKTLLEIGCGNGWLTNYLQQQTGSMCIGIDVNQLELKQAARVFRGNTNLSFVCGDINSIIFRPRSFDVAILASSLQYFHEVPPLVHNILSLLRPSGALHIIDTPVYSDAEVDGARSRSAKHFEQLGFPQMSESYHHHVWSSLTEFKPEVRHNPFALHNRLLRKINNNSPFPWIIIRTNL